MTTDHTPAGTPQPNFHAHVPGAEHQTPGNQATEHPDPFKGIDPELDREYAEQQASEQAAAEAPRPALFSAKWPWPEVTPADLAELYQAAAVMITIKGYDAYHRDNYEGARGIDILTALEMAAEGFLRGRADDLRIGAEDIAVTLEREARNLAEDLETKLAAVLYVLGQQHYRTGIQDLADRVAAWELGHDDIHRHVDAPMALALLEHAAGIYAMVGATDGADPVTTAPAPGNPHVIHTPGGGS